MLGEQNIIEGWAIPVEKLGTESMFIKLFYSRKNYVDLYRIESAVYHILKNV